MDPTLHRTLAQRRCSRLQLRKLAVEDLGIAGSKISGHGSPVGYRVHFIQRYIPLNTHFLWRAAGSNRPPAACTSARAASRPGKASSTPCSHWSSSPSTWEVDSHWPAKDMNTTCDWENR